MNDEEWRDVVGYEDFYQVSSIGRVKSKRDKTRIKDRQDRIMCQKYDNKGYLRVNLHKDGVCKAELVSRLVAGAFIPNPDGLPQVGHDDDNRSNNHISNLYWTDSYENNRHNGKLERFHDAHNAKIDVIARKLSQKVRAIAMDGSHELMFDSMQEAGRNGFDNGKISMCVNGKRNSHRGYRWERCE